MGGTKRKTRKNLKNRRKIGGGGGEKVKTIINSLFSRRKTLKRNSKKPRKNIIKLDNGRVLKYLFNTSIGSNNTSVLPSKLIEASKHKNTQLSNGILNNLNEELFKIPNNVRALYSVPNKRGNPNQAIPSQATPSQATKKDHYSEISSIASRSENQSANNLYRTRHSLNSKSIYGFFNNLEPTAEQKILPAENYVDINGLSIKNGLNPSKEIDIIELINYYNNLLEANNYLRNYKITPNYLKSIARYRFIFNILKLIDKEKSQDISKYTFKITDLNEIYKIIVFNFIKVLELYIAYENTTLDDNTKSSFVSNIKNYTSIIFYYSIFIYSFDTQTQTYINIDTDTQKILNNIKLYIYKTYKYLNLLLHSKNKQFNVSELNNYYEIGQYNFDSDDTELFEQYLDYIIFIYSDESNKSLDIKSNKYLQNITNSLESKKLNYIITNLSIDNYKYKLLYNTNYLNKSPIDIFVNINSLDISGDLLEQNLIKNFKIPNEADKLQFLLNLIDSYLIIIRRINNLFNIDDNKIKTKYNIKNEIYNINIYVNSIYQISEFLLYSKYKSNTKIAEYIDLSKINEHSINENVKTSFTLLVDTLNIYFNKLQEIDTKAHKSPTLKRRSHSLVNRNTNNKIADIVRLNRSSIGRKTI